jgi:hypothetical protein
MKECATKKDIKKMEKKDKKEDLAMIKKEIKKKKK